MVQNTKLCNWLDHGYSVYSEKNSIEFNYGANSKISYTRPDIPKITHLKRKAKLSTIHCRWVMYLVFWGPRSFSKFNEINASIVYLFEFKILSVALAGRSK